MNKKDMPLLDKAKHYARELNQFINPSEHKTKEPLINIIETNETKKNIKSSDRITTWLNSHNFCSDKHIKSDLIKFLRNCPLGKDVKKLSVHNTNITKNNLTLMLKDEGSAICFNLLRVKGEFVIKTTNEAAWVFNNSGKLVKRIEHKKARIWLVDHGIILSKDTPSDLEKFLSSCPICNSKKPLRYHRSTDKRLDLQCGCVNYFRLFDKDGLFRFTHRSTTLREFSKEGAVIGLDQKN
jgi:hypothetical protein